jgi:hypothetical protein
MKAKKILIVYNPSFEGITTREAMLSKVVSDLVNEGRKVSKMNKSNYNSYTNVVFEDGTKVQMLPIGKYAIGMRVTHLFIDKSIYEIENAKQFVNEALISCVVPQGIYENFDADSTMKSRIATFEMDGELKIKHFSGE